jgi:hypothetical protein
MSYFSEVDFTAFCIVACYILRIIKEVIMSTESFVPHQHPEIPISTVRDILSYAKNNYKTEENISDILLTVSKIKYHMKRKMD